MKKPDRIGAIAILPLIAAGSVYALHHPSSVFLEISIGLQLLALLLFIYAGVRGSRLWLIEPLLYLLFVGYFVWLLSQGH